MRAKFKKRLSTLSSMCCSTNGMTNPNWAFSIDAQRFLKLSLCLDLTYSQGPGGEHQMGVCGVSLHIQRSHWMQVAKTGGLDEHGAGQKNLTGCWP